MFLTPKLVIIVQDYPSTFKTPVACYLLNSQYIIITLAKLSIALVAFMAFSRWFSIIHPFKYRRALNQKHVCICLTIISFLEIAFSLRTLLAMSFASGKCQRSRYPSWSTQEANTTFIIIYTLLTFFIPVITCWLMFGHIYLHLRRLKDDVTSGALFKRRKSLLRMCVVTAVIMTLCWTPSEIYLLISASGLELSLSRGVRLQIHDITKTLGFLNSCVNPFIYCLTNRVYRKEFSKVVNAILWRRRVDPNNSGSNDIELK